MRFVIYGAGAIGGVIGARLNQQGHDVTLIARGNHLAAIRKSGLRIESPEADGIVRAPVVGHPSEIEFGPDHVVVLAMKSQDTGAALSALSASAPADIPVLCAQNGVENERAASRLFPSVYGVHVMLPASHLEDGVVQASSAPVTGMLDLGRYPGGADDTANRVADAFNGSSFDARPLTDIMRWKYRKLVMNLGNAAEALVEPGPGEREITRRAEEEGETCLIGAGIEFASRKEDRARRGNLLRVQPVRGRHRGGGSSWQSLARGAGSIEADYLNGEIVMLGRLHGIPTPVNELLQRLANRAAAERLHPASMTSQEVLDTLDQLT
jgi:2-dehydropantoate 2-reductase